MSSVSRKASAARVTPLRTSHGDASTHGGGSSTPQHASQCPNSNNNNAASASASIPFQLSIVELALALEVWSSYISGGDSSRSAGGGEIQRSHQSSSNGGGGAVAASGGGCVEDFSLLITLLQAMHVQLHEALVDFYHAKFHEELGGRATIADFAELIVAGKEFHQKFLEANPQQKDDLLDAYIAVGGEYDTGGCVDIAIMKDLIDEFGLRIDVDYVVRMLDTDGNAEIDFEEFSELLKSGDALFAGKNSCNSDIDDNGGGGGVGGSISARKGGARTLSFNLYGDIDDADFGDGWDFHNNSGANNNSDIKGGGGLVVDEAAAQQQQQPSYHRHQQQHHPAASSPDEFLLDNTSFHSSSELYPMATATTLQPRHQQSHHATFSTPPREKANGSSRSEPPLGLLVQEASLAVSVGDDYTPRGAASSTTQHHHYSRFGQSHGAYSSSAAGSGSGSGSSIKKHLPLQPHQKSLTRSHLRMSQRINDAVENPHLKHSSQRDVWLDQGFQPVPPKRSAFFERLIQCVSSIPVLSVFRGRCGDLMLQADSNGEPKHIGRVFKAYAGMYSTAVRRSCNRLYENGRKPPTEKYKPPTFLINEPFRPAGSSAAAATVSRNGTLVLAAASPTARWKTLPGHLLGAPTRAAETRKKQIKVTRENDDDGGNDVAERLKKKKKKQRERKKRREQRKTQHYTGSLDGYSSLSDSTDEEEEEEFEFVQVDGNDEVDGQQDDKKTKKNRKKSSASSASSSLYSTTDSDDNNNNKTTDGDDDEKSLSTTTLGGEGGALGHYRSQLPPGHPLTQPRQLLEQRDGCDKGEGVDDVQWSTEQPQQPPAAQARNNANTTPNSNTTTAVGMRGRDDAINNSSHKGTKKRSFGPPPPPNYHFFEAKSQVPGLCFTASQSAKQFRAPSSNFNRLALEYQQQHFLAAQENKGQGNTTLAGRIMAGKPAASQMLVGGGSSSSPRSLVPKSPASGVFRQQSQKTEQPSSSSSSSPATQQQQQQRRNVALAAAPITEKKLTCSFNDEGHERNGFDRKLYRCYHLDALDKYKRHKYAGPVQFQQFRSQELVHFARGGGGGTSSNLPHSSSSRVGMANLALSPFNDRDGSGYSCGRRSHRRGGDGVTPSTWSGRHFGEGGDDEAEKNSDCSSDGGACLRALRKAEEDQM